MQIAVLGPVAVVGDDGTPVPVAGTRLRRLLILLALDPGRVVATGRLVAGLWAGSPPAAAANALQALVSRLRRILPDGAVESHPTGYRLAVPAEAVDLVRFERLAATGRRLLPTDPGRADAVLTEALDLWRGPALADLDGAEVTAGLLARIDEVRLGAVEDRIQARLALGAADALVPELRDLVTAYPLRERPAAQLIRALRAAGRTAEALSAYERFRAELADQLGVDPSAELAALHLDLLRTPDPAPTLGGPAGADRAGADRARAPGAGPATAPRDRATGPADAAPPPVTSNLPAPLSSFVGREQDRARVAALVRASRLTTLTGPGGAGKTRLAVESGRALLGDAPGGVWLVELAPVTDPDEVPHTVLSALGLREQALVAGNRARVPAAEPVDPIDRLAAAIGSRRLVLILDNCEHLIDAAARLAGRLLGACPQLRVLATSREPLGITGEALRPVDSLALPPPDVGAERAPDYPAVRLLIDRAAAVRPGFAVTADTVAAVAGICRALDGMPLAIELAAARLRSMTPAQLAARLDDRFRLLTGGSRTALPRHQTLRAVVDWSWDLLDGSERALLRRLSVFAGGATGEAVERVCAGPDLAAEDVFDRLTALVDKSLVVLVDGPAPRYRLLETIREYGLSRLVEAGEADRVRRTHAEEYLAVAEAADAHLRGPDQLAWLGRLSAEHDNTITALRWAITADKATAIRFVAALGWYWWLRGHRVEGVGYARQVLGDPEAEAQAPAESYAHAYAVTAMLVMAAGQGDLAEGQAWLSRAAALAGPHRAHNPLLRLIEPTAAAIESYFSGPQLDIMDRLFDDPDVWVASTARIFHALSEQNLGRPDETAAAHLRAAAAGYAALGERWGSAFSLMGLADLISRRGDHGQAAECYQQALRMLHELRIAEDVPEVQARLAHELWHLGEHTRALELLAEAEREAERLGSDDSRAAVVYTHADILRSTGDWPAARERLDRGAELLEGKRTAQQTRAVFCSSRAVVAGADGDLAAARTMHAEALRLAFDSHDAPVIGIVLVGYADLALRAGRPESAAVLLGAAAGVRGGGPDRSLLDGRRIEAAVREALGPAGFADAYARGLPTTADGAAELVRAALDG
ncbi:BTAD domain-containing putative transcriptional regulator [Plantactinospora sp. KBS50]|uniref:AfsR/SARP family transcriptional regulator n=1 Tax=Plantactinospora sp. KBS50 TaxID=2024580 RepID=UPI000BAAFA4C|nr:BTAD domain-containing putative transcriptional regulator [Plantactinospora sp. KBS50]ASW53918.1 hypothetical protein CIK06_06580 [Plantactinospora sp. KBS50]